MVTCSTSRIAMPRMARISSARYSALRGSDRGLRVAGQADGDAVGPVVAFVGLQHVAVQARGEVVALDEWGEFLRGGLGCGDGFVDAGCVLSACLRCVESGVEVGAGDGKIGRASC